MFPIVIQHVVRAPSALRIPYNFLLAWVCLLPVTEVHWEPLAYENSECSFPTRSPLQWKRFKYFGNCMSRQFSPKVSKSLMDIQLQIIPSATGCDADHHIKRGRIMWKRVFQLILITCQVNKYPSDLSTTGDLDEAHEDTVSKTWVRVLSNVALAFQAQTHQGEAQ